jgi:hypothetical protein
MSAPNGALSQSPGLRGTSYPGHRPQIIIAGQEEHHRKVSFQDELRALLKRHEVEWDEKYVWD